MEPAWRADLARNLDAHAGDPAARWVQLATIRPDGGPAVRTVVYRGDFHDEGLVFTTDARAGKVAHIAHEPRVEVCWYFREAREQLRVAGKMEAVVADTADAARQARRAEVWAGLSDEVRRGFGGGAPGRPIESGASGGEGAGPGDGAGKGGPPETFALLVLWPEQVDHVTLAVEPHRRWLHARDTAGCWHRREVHP